MRLSPLVLLVASLVFGACGTDSSGQSADDAGQSVADEVVNTTATPVTTNASAPLPELAFVTTQDAANGEAVEIYISLSDASNNPVQSTAGASVDVRFVDALDAVLFDQTSEVEGSDLMVWSSRLSGQEHTGFVVSVPKDDIERSLAGVRGTAYVDLDFGDWYFELESELFSLPEASQAEKDQAAMEQFLATSVELSHARVTTRNFWLEPDQAGCISTVDFLGEVVEGIRVDFTIFNTSDGIERFFDDALLQTPDGLTVERSYESTLTSTERLPDTEATGFLLFEDLECEPGEYRVVLSNYRSGVYLDEDFVLRR